jgi:hypothetical protein
MSKKGEYREPANIQRGKKLFKKTIDGAVTSDDIFNMSNAGHISAKT